MTYNFLPNHHRAYITGLHAKANVPLSKRHRSGSEEGQLPDFEMLLKEQLPGLIRYATALTRDADEALDLAEDTVLEALASDDPPSSESELHVWLLTILHDHRANPFRQPDPLAAPSHHPKTEAPSLKLSDLDRALGQLPEKQRAVILLVGLEGMSDDQTSATLRISARAVSSRLAHARENLCRILGVKDERLAQAS
jgi:RNA polymerase sigma-70 factor, ECF subfamily